MRASVRSGPGRRTRDQATLAVGSLANGILAYVYVALGTRSFGADAFAPISVVWSVWALGAAVLTFPFQHRVINLLRSGADVTTLQAENRRLGFLAVFTAVLITAVLWPYRLRVFGDGALAYPVVAGVVVLGSAALGLLRGHLSGHGRYTATATSMWLEQLVRVAAGLAVVVTGGTIIGYAWSLALGALTLAAWPTGIRAVRVADAPTATSGNSLTRYLATVAGGTALAQLVLTGSPIVLSTIGAADAHVTGLFTTLAVSRAPYLVALGSAIRLMSDFTDRVTRGGPASLRDTCRVTVRSTVAGAMVVGGLAAVAGPFVLGLVFGGDATLGALATGGVAAAAVLAVASLTLTLVFIATDHLRTILATRAAAVALFLAVSFVDWTLPLTRVVVAFVGSEVLAFTLLALATRQLRDAPMPQGHPAEGQVR